jgi:hypothetical protein
MNEISELFNRHWLVITAAAIVVAAMLFLVLWARRPLRFQRAAILTRNEMEFYGRIRTALPHLNVFPQLSMAAVIRPKESGKRYGRAFAKICAKRIDFTICDESLNVICVIELDDRTHDKAKDAERDAMVSSAGIRTIRYESRAKPDPAKIRSDVLALVGS